MQIRKFIVLLILAAVLLSSCTETTGIPAAPYIDLNAVPAWEGEACFVIDHNVPGFTEDDVTTRCFELYSPLDSLGRCGTAYACIGQELMPTAEREPLYVVTPSGWNDQEYAFIEGGNLYNRCHLIGFQLTGENANQENLITGTRYLNMSGMLPYENKVAQHIRKEDHHVLYRITPVYQEDALVCSGVQMEAYCVECSGEFMFHVFCYNIQPGVLIDYLTGCSSENEIGRNGEVKDYVLNTSSKKFHYPDCSSTQTMSEKNRKEVSCTREELIYQGYKPCGSCKP